MCRCALAIRSRMRHASATASEFGSGPAAGMSRGALVNKWVRGEHSPHGRARPFRPRLSRARWKLRRLRRHRHSQCHLLIRASCDSAPAAGAETCRRLVSVARRFGPTSGGACRSAGPVVTPRSWTALSRQGPRQPGPAPHSNPATACVAPQTPERHLRRTAP
jgi:hypothetical protein